LGNDVAHDHAQAPRGVELDLERLAREELMNALDPECLNRIEVNLPPRLQLVQEGDILAHVVETAARSAASLRRQHSRDAVPLQDSLHSPLAQAENLAAPFCQKPLGLERKPHFLCVLSNHQRHRQRTLATKGSTRRECRQFSLMRAWPAGSESKIMGDARQGQVGEGRGAGAHDKSPFAGALQKTVR
jgi:hypothetical protein